MAKQESRTVSVAMCHSPAEAMMIQAMLSARGIHAIIPGASAASLTAAATAFSSRVLVDEADAEEASALIAELRAEAASAAPGQGEDGNEDGNENGDGDGDDRPEAREEARALEKNFDAQAARTRRRRMIIASICISLMFPMGAGHLLQRAWGRAIALIGLDVLGLRYLFAGHHRTGAALLVTAIVLDAFGSAILAARRFSVAARPALPAAKLMPRPR